MPLEARYSKITFFFATSDLRKFRRTRGYLHFMCDGCVPDAVALQYASLYQSLTHARVEGVKQTRSYVEMSEVPQSEAELYNAGILIFRLSDGEFDSIIVPGISSSLVNPITNKLIDSPVFAALANALIANNLSPRAGVSVIEYVGGYYATLRALNQ